MIVLAIVGLFTALMLYCFGMAYLLAVLTEWLERRR